MPVRQQIAHLEHALVILRRHADEALIVAIARAAAARAFSARELWEHAQIAPTLATAIADAGVSSCRQLGKRLRRLAWPRRRGRVDCPVEP